MGSSGFHVAVTDASARSREQSATNPSLWASSRPRAAIHHRHGACALARAGCPNPRLATAPRVLTPARRRPPTHLGTPKRRSSIRSSASTSRPFSREPVRKATRCRASSSASSAPISIVASLPGASFASMVMPAAATASFPFPAKAEFVPPAVAGAWPTPPHISSTASCPRSPCASGCSRFPSRSATAWPTTPVSRARS